MAKKNVLTRGKKQQALALMQQGQPIEARPLLEQIYRMDRSDTEALFMLGIANGMLGEHAKAEQAFRQILKLAPNHPDANNNLGLSLESQGHTEEAILYFERAVQLAPNNAGFVFNYANTFESLGELEQAKVYYEKAIALEPNYPEAFCNLGNVLQAEGEYVEAVAAFQKAIAMSDNFARHYPQIFINLGNALMELGHDDEAVQAYQRAIAMHSQYAEGYLSLGNAYLKQGRRQEALDVLRHAILLKPIFGRAYWNLVQTKRYTERDTDMEELETLYQKPSLTDEDKMNFAFALGKVYADLNDDKRSFEYYLSGNQLKRNSIDYAIADDVAYFDAIKQVFSVEFFQRYAGIGSADTTPIFIIGMPRSGTSLVEQILASHSQVYGAGELNDMRNVIEHTCDNVTEKYPRCLLMLDDSELSAIGSAYLTRLHAYAPDAARITDKMPHNFLHLGLIHLGMPGAKIIHCRRNPMDNALSIFKTLFMIGHSYAYDLAELGQYYRLYQDLMAHWRHVLPNAFYELRYEDLVADQETQTRRLLEYCDLPWEDACLAFHHTQRVVRTASLVQVRQPIHANSVEGWRRYEQQLQPFIAALKA